MSLALNTLPPNWFNQYTDYTNYVQQQEGENFKLEGERISLDLIHPDAPSLRLNIQLKITDAQDNFRQSLEEIKTFNTNSYEYICSFKEGMESFIDLENKAHTRINQLREGKFDFVESVVFENQAQKQDFLKKPILVESGRYFSAFSNQWVSSGRPVQYDQFGTALKSLRLMRDKVNDLALEIKYDDNADNAGLMNFIKALSPLTTTELYKGLLIRINGRVNVEKVIINFVYYGFLPICATHLAKSSSFTGFLDAHPEVKDSLPIPSGHFPRNLSEFESLLT